MRGFTLAKLLAKLSVPGRSASYIIIGVVALLAVSHAQTAEAQRKPPEQIPISEITFDLHTNPKMGLVLHWVTKFTAHESQLSGFVFDDTSSHKRPLDVRHIPAEPGPPVGGTSIFEARIGFGYPGAELQPGDDRLQVEIMADSISGTQHGKGITTINLHPVVAFFEQNRDLNTANHRILWQEIGVGATSVGMWLPCWLAFFNIRGGNGFSPQF
jgi:hypothetical protein